MLTLEERMYKYESVSKHYLTRNTPVILRIDGRAWHTFTKRMPPFWNELRGALVFSALKLIKDIQGFKLAYIQSDEISIWLDDTDTHSTEPWFGNNMWKLVSMSSSIITAHFNDMFDLPVLCYFDSRAFNVPESDVINYFLWRSKDNQRNVVERFASQHFSHKQLQNKNTKDKLKMLAEKGFDIDTQVLPEFRNGTFISKDENGSLVTNINILPKYDAINNLIGK